MAIIEKKIPMILLIVLILTTCYISVVSLNYMMSSQDISELDINKLDEDSQGIGNFMIILEAVGKTAVLQIEGAPQFINTIMMVFAVLLWSVLVLIIIALAREMIGLT